MRVLICGGRTFNNYDVFMGHVISIQSKYGNFKTIIHGGANGADRCASLFANSPTDRKEEICFPADWDKYGRAAGPIRNQRMLDEGKPNLVIAFPGGRGTADMVRRATAAGIKVIKIDE